MEQKRKVVKDHFAGEAAQLYDKKNRALAPIADNMHFLVRLILKDAPRSARVLCVGVGTGVEIVSLAKEYPEWTFVGVDPSASMIEVCTERLAQAGIADRCSLLVGYVEDVPSEETFDAVLSILVGHFIKQADRLDFYQHIHQRLKEGGCFINTEISYDVESSEFLSMLLQWEKVQTLMGATPQSIASLPKVLKEILTVLPPAVVEASMRASGFSSPMHFFQAFMIRGWYAVK